MRKSIFGLLMLLFIGAAAAPTLANNRNQSPMNVEAMKARVHEAEQKDKRLIVKLKNGVSLSGLVSTATDKGFSIMQTHNIFGDGDSIWINYDEVAEMKWRNPFIKVLKTIGTYAVLSPGLPLWLAIEAYSHLVYGEGPPSC